MEDLKLDDDLAPPGVGMPPTTGLGPLPRVLLARECGMARGSRAALRLVTESVNRRRRAQLTDEGRRRFRSDDLQPSSGAEELAEEHLLSRTEFSTINCKLASSSNDEARVLDGAVHNVVGAGNPSGKFYST